MAELSSIGRVRTLSQWLRKTGKKAEEFPKIDKLTPAEIFDAKQFASNVYPRPARWTVRLYDLAKQG